MRCTPSKSAVAPIVTAVLIAATGAEPRPEAAPRTASASEAAPWPELLSAAAPAAELLSEAAHRPASHAEAAPRAEPHAANAPPRRSRVPRGRVDRRPTPGLRA